MIAGRKGLDKWKIQGIVKMVIGTPPRRASHLAGHFYALKGYNPRGNQTDREVVGSSPTARKA